MGRCVCICMLSMLLWACPTAAGHGPGVICMKKERCAQEQRQPVFGPEKIKKDLIGQHIGPVGRVKVHPSTSGDYSAQVYMDIPMGLILDETNITDVRVIDAEITGDRARVVAQVKTVSNYAGRLLLHYYRIAGEWYLKDLENLNFKAQ